MMRDTVGSKLRLGRSANARLVKTRIVESASWKNMGSTVFNPNRGYYSDLHQQGCRVSHHHLGSGKEPEPHFIIFCSNTECETATWVCVQNMVTPNDFGYVLKEFRWIRAQKQHGGTYVFATIQNSQRLTFSEEGPSDPSFSFLSTATVHPAESFCCAL